jgi:hypothetical protein
MFMETTKEYDMQRLEGPIESIRIQEAYGIGLQLKEQITSEYGTGFPYNAMYVDQRGVMYLPRNPKAFHNLFHSTTGETDAVTLGIALGYDPEMLALGGLTMLGHDADVTSQRGRDETESADALAGHLEDTNTHYDREIFTPRHKALVWLAVRGTEPLFNEKGILVDQFATQQDYPDEEAATFALGTACADLGILYKPIGPYMGHQLYREISDANKPGEAPSLDGLLTFQRNQLEFIEDYRYPLPMAEQVLATHRAQVLRYDESVLEQLERGDIETWEQLEKQDLAFYALPLSPASI